MPAVPVGMASRLSPPIQDEHRPRPLPSPLASKQSACCSSRAFELRTNPGENGIAYPLNRNASDRVVLVLAFYSSPQGVGCVFIRQPAHLRCEPPCVGVYIIDF